MENLLGRYVCGVLRCTKVHKDSQTNDQRTALKKLRKLEDEMVLLANKGNITVAIKREDYINKMMEMLETTTFR